MIVRGCGLYSFGGRRIRKSVPFHFRYRFTPVTLLVRELALNFDRSQVSYSWTASAVNGRVPSHPWNRLASRTYRFTVSSFTRAPCRMKVSNFIRGCLRFGLRILARIPVLIALAPRVGLVAHRSAHPGVHADHLLGFVPLGPEQGGRGSRAA